MVRPLLCKLGLHKEAGNVYLRVWKQNGKRRWHVNYVICARCGKRLRKFGIQKRRSDNGAQQ